MDIKNWLKNIGDDKKILRPSGHKALKLAVFQQGSNWINWIQSFTLIIIGWSLVINGLGFLGQRL